MQKNKTNILPTINSPKDLRKLSIKELTDLCEELRACLIDHCSTNSGHFGASLGTVELTLALHYVFNTPYDKLIWDVGHQAYSHKLITGRRENFETNRKYEGISGFPKLKESEYDAFGTGHASTSISAALGMAVAAKLNEENRKIIAVIGDGSLTGGLAFEGLNNTGWLKSDLLVVFNDNDMAIDRNVGAMNEYFTKLTSSGKYNRIKKSIWDFLGENKLRYAMQRLGNTMKSMVMKEGNFFEALGFRYFGPIDGHNIPNLLLTLNRLKNIPGPKLLHVITKKGKGYEPAELNPPEWHAPGLFDKETGKKIVSKEVGKPMRYQDVFGEAIVELAEMNKKIIGVTPAMPSGSSLNIMMDKMPDRAFDVGIAEGHAVTFSAGAACAGHVPFCNIYSSFMQRAYDNVIHDVAIQNLQVIFCLDRGGLVGEDGPTHHGVYDLAYFRLVPNIIVSAPMNEEELRNLMYTAQLKNNGPFTIRYPRGNGVMSTCPSGFQEIEIGKGQTLRAGKDIAILSIGHPGNFASKACDNLEEEGYKVTHCNMRFLKPIDEDILHEVGANHQHVVTVEDGTIVGGLGTAVAEFFKLNNYSTTVVKLGVPDRFVGQGTPDQLFKECGYDQQGIYNTLKKILNKGDII